MHYNPISDISSMRSVGNLKSPIGIIKEEQKKEHVNDGLGNDESPKLERSCRLKLKIVEALVEFRHTIF